jgi:hypothetical protein
VFRSVVVGIDGEPFARLEPTFTLALPIVELDAPHTLAEVLRHESARWFDLGAAPAIRALLVRRGTDEHVLLVTLHHIIVDGWSVGVFNRELTVAYAARARGVVPTLPALRSSYAAYSAWQRERLAGPVLAGGLAYWREQLRDAPPYLDFPGRSDVSERGAEGRVRRRLIDRATADALVAFSRSARATLYSTLVATFSVLFRRYTDQRDIVIGCAVANRARSEDEDAIGFFVNTLPLRARLRDEATFTQLLAEIHAMTLAAFDHAEVPFACLIEDLNPPSVASRTPFVSVMFVLQNTPYEAPSLDGLEVTPVWLDRGNAKFDLTLQCCESAQGINASIEYRTSLFDDATIDGMLEAFETLAVAALRRADLPISRLPLVSAAAERAQLCFCARLGPVPVVRFDDEATWIAGPRTNPRVDGGGDDVALHSLYVGHHRYAQGRPGSPSRYRVAREQALRGRDRSA